MELTAEHHRHTFEFDDSVQLVGLMPIGFDRDHAARFAEERGPPVLENRERTAFAP
jgi:hypothetical protein